MSLNNTQRRQRSYERDIARTIRGCATDAVLWSLFAVALLGMAAALYTGRFVPEMIVPYRKSVMFLCLTGGLLTAAKALQSALECRAAKIVKERSVYTVMLTQAQQNRIFRSVCGQSFLEHMTYFLAGALPVSGLLYYLYTNTGDISPLLVMAAVDGVLLFLTLLSFGLDAARLASVDGFCTVSDRGIITANEILPFSAEEGDIRSMEPGDDIYDLRFQRICFLGTRRNYRFPLPKGGELDSTVRAQDGASEEDILRKTFCLTARTLETVPGTDAGEEKALEQVSAEPAETAADSVAEPETITGSLPISEGEDVTDTEAVPEEVASLISDSATGTEEAPEQEMAAPAAETEPAETPSLEIVTETEPVAESAEAVITGTDTAGNGDTESEVSVGRQNRWIRGAAAVMALILIAALGTSILKNRSGGNEPTEMVPAGPKQPVGSKTEEHSGTDQQFVDDVPRSGLMQDEEGVWYGVVGGEKVILVNKDHPVPESYGGVDETASGALEEMIRAAEAEGISLYLVSGYRNYELQGNLYETKVAQVGETNAEFWTAPPGTSEHQTGLAFDVNETDNSETLMDTSFEGTKAFEWLSDNCAQYGFILRYPKGSRDITGFNYEPWHLRYVGTTAAAQIMAEGITLAEYLGVG
jgi:D-alanyl-D-alanine carboxypeptidase